MDLPAFEREVTGLAAELSPEERRGLAAVVPTGDAPPHPVVRDELLLHQVEPGEGGDGGRILLHHGALVRLASPGRQADLLRAAFERAVQEWVDLRAAEQEIRTEEDLFRAHADFRRGESLPAGWYRRGERLAPGVYAVDADLFVEVTLPRDRWTARRGAPLSLSVEGDEIEFDVPGVPAPDEAWTIEGAGLFEPDPGLDAEDLEDADDEEVPGTFGDLHLLPGTYDES